ncbi:NAD-dependent epimerase/dehydratase family protein [Anaeromyxobacter oryzisoli]|uniref:NAD-dependent epimerase/dehydratase family protein n=1 Tax=Anaeromyxobacter oryzisoli TaxID=2925408 RepID=UPI001F59F99B|nr:NAD-dependent epimerase/dehydratase family protein [Anaeromyxobacter sp. SG63]
MARLALLTGSTGAVAEAIAAALGDSGYAVRHLPVGPGGALEPGPEARGAELVVHLGVRTPRDLDEALRAEVESAAALGAARIAREVGARRLVHVSTASVYGRPRNLPCREGELKAPRTAYERIRWRAEQASWAAFRRGAPLTVLRPTLLYGPTLRGGPVRALALVSLFNQRRRRVPIIRRGPVAHLCHLADLARAVAHVAGHPDDRAVVGRAFNVGDDAPLPLAEHLAAALTALGYEPGRVLPTAPRLTGALLWLVRHVPDRTLLAPLNRRLGRAWSRVTVRPGPRGMLVPRVDREALHWMSADHYYDTSRLAALGWRPLHPVSTASMPETIRALIASQVLPGTGGRALPAW